MTQVWLKRRSEYKGVNIKKQPSEIVAEIAIAASLTVEQEIAVLQYLHTTNVILITSEDLKEYLDANLVS